MSLMASFIAIFTYPYILIRYQMHTICVASLARKVVVGCCLRVLIVGQGHATDGFVLFKHDWSLYNDAATSYYIVFSNRGFEVLNDCILSQTLILISISIISHLIIQLLLNQIVSQWTTNYEFKLFFIPFINFVSLLSLNLLNLLH